MINTPAISNLIRESKTAQIYSAIQTGAQMGMQTLEAALAQLVKAGTINYADAIVKTSRPDDFNKLVGPQAAAMAARSGASH